MDWARLSRYVPLIAAGLLSGCGGEEGGVTSRLPLPAIPIALSQASMDQTIAEGATSEMVVTAVALSGVKVPAFPNIQYDTSVFSDVTVTEISSGQYRIAAKISSDMDVGPHTGNIVFKLCADKTCRRVYPSSVTPFGYSVTSVQKDWVTYQRDSARSGYVRITVDPAKISKSWDWAFKLPSRASAFDTLTTPVADGRNVYFASSYKLVFGSIFGFQGLTLHALNLGSGAEVWGRTRDHRGLGSPSLANGKVYLTHLGFQGANHYFAYATTNGADTDDVLYNTNWMQPVAAAPFDDRLYFSVATYTDDLGSPAGSVINALNTSSPSVSWASLPDRQLITSGQFPAVDEKYIYQYGGKDFQVFDRASGALLSNIPDPAFVATDYGGTRINYGAGPMIASDKTVIAFSGPAANGHSYNFQPMALGRALVAYNVQAGVSKWTTGKVYSTAPAEKSGVLYVGRADGPAVDAIDVATGAKLWSWQAPEGSAIFGSVVLTKNLALVSTDRRIYAIDLSTRKAVWELPTPGTLIIAPGKILVVTECAYDAAKNSLKAVGRVSGYRLG